MKKLLTAAIVIIVITATSCTKQNIIPTENEQLIYVDIEAVDNDGATTTSSTLIVKY